MTSFKSFNFVGNTHMAVNIDFESELAVATDISFILKYAKLDISVAVGMIHILAKTKIHALTGRRNSTHTT